MEMNVPARSPAMSDSHRVSVQSKRLHLCPALLIPSFPLPEFAPLIPYNISQIIIEGFCNYYLPLFGISHKKGADHASSNANTTKNRNAQKPLFGNLVVNELSKVGSLQVCGLLVEEELVVAAGFGVVAELVVAEGEVVEALAAAFGGGAEDVGEEADAELLVAAVCGLDEALGG